MQIQQLLYFVEVCDQGSFNKAAEKLFVSQPNISKAIANLENELNIHLFTRTNKGVALTEQGQKLYQYSQTIIKQMELIQGIASKDVYRKLSVSSYPISSMGSLVSEFYNIHKGENIAIHMEEQRLQKVIENVECGDSEIGFVMINNAQYKEVNHMLNYKNLVYHPLCKDTWYLNVGPKSPFYNRDEVAMSELLNYTFVRFPDDYFSNLTYYLKIDGICLKEFEKVIHINDTASIITLLQSTDVFRFGPGLSAQDYAKFGIRSIPIRNCDMCVEAGWIQRKREKLSPEAESFVQILNMFTEKFRCSGKQ